MTPTGRGLATLGLFYGAAAVVPPVLGLVAFGPHFFPVGPPPEGHPRTCADPLECGSWFPDGWDVLAVALLFLGLSLTIALPVCLYLIRRRAWPPVRAGALSAVAAWLITAALTCGTLALFAR